jgi:hypothetical protein
MSVRAYPRADPTSTERPASTTAAGDSGHVGGFEGGDMRLNDLPAMTSLKMTAAIVGPTAGLFLILILGLGYYAIRLRKVS